MRFGRTLLTLLLGGLLMAPGAAGVRAAAAAEARGAAAAELTQGFREDFDTAWREIGASYAYFDRKATRWGEIPALYRADLERVRTKAEFIALLEQVVDELYDAHAQLNVNSPKSWRLVPSGADLWAEWRDGRAVITDVRVESDAARAGISPGDVVVAIGGMPVAEAVTRRLGRSYPDTVAAARDWALRSVLAGRHETVRSVRLRTASRERDVDLPPRDQYGGRAREPLAVTTLPSGFGQIRFHDSLGESVTVSAFDRALQSLRDAPGLVIDLRDTPSGGNSSVARAILGRFVAREAPYQKHELPAEERETGIRRAWLELVAPRGPFRYPGPVVVSVGHWTGSMGEGIAIGFDATGSGAVVGTPMAGLLGATYHITLPRTEIGINIPSERLYHVNGTPREEFRPAAPVPLGDFAAMAQDSIEEKAILAVEDEWTRAEVARDEATLRRVLDDRFTFNSSAGAMTGKEDLIRMILAGHMTAQTVTERTVLVDGDAGVVFGTAELKFQAPGESESVSLLRYTATYVKRAGHWRAIAIHMSKRTAP